MNPAGTVCSDLLLIVTMLMVLIQRYLYGLSELQVERHDTNTLQPGGESGPRTPAALFMTGRTGAGKQLHHELIWPPEHAVQLLRSSIALSGIVC